MEKFVAFMYQKVFTHLFAEKRGLFMIKKLLMTCVLSISVASFAGPHVYAAEPPALLPAPLPSISHKYKFEIFVDLNTAIATNYQDGSFGRQFKTIQQAIDYIESQPFGSTSDLYTVYIAGGSYGENVRIHGDGKSISLVGLGTVSTTKIFWVIGEKKQVKALRTFSPQLAIKTINNIFRNGSGRFSIAENFRSVHKGKIKPQGVLEMSASVAGNLVFKTAKKPKIAFDLFLFNCVLGTVSPSGALQNGKINLHKYHGIRLQTAESTTFNGSIKVDDYDKIHLCTIKDGMKLLTSTAGASSFGILSTKCAGEFSGRSGSKYNLDGFTNYWFTPAATATLVSPAVIQVFENDTP